MDSLRKVLKWISRHRLLSFIVFFLVLSSVIYIRSVVRQYEGEWTEPIQKGNIVESVYGIGTITANKIFKIAPGVTYTIRAVYVKEGDSVKKGAPLIATDSAAYRSPFAGTITALPIKVGDNVFPGMPIVTLVDLADRYLVVSLEQQGALRVKAGQKVKMSFDTIREQNYDGKVQAVYSNENNFLARIDVGFLPQQILPGMTADVAIEIQQHNDVLLIPVSALEAGNIVWIKTNHGLPKKVLVKTGIISGPYAEIIEGDIHPGDRLLIKGKTK